MSHQKQDNQLRASVVGVDLGSQSMQVAAVERGVVEVLANEANLRQTPALLAFGNQQRLMGDAALSRLKSNLSNSISAPQRLLGWSSGPWAAAESKYAPCVWEQQGEGLKFRVRWMGQDQEVRAEQATAALLNKVHDIVQLNQLNTKFQAIAVPNYLSHNEREALLGAVRIARDSREMTFNYGLVSQGAAAALDYAFSKQRDWPQLQSQAPLVVFLDFGHSKLSVYGVKFTKHYLKVVHQQHLRQLGCRQLDHLMLEFYASAFEEAHPDLETKVLASPKAVAKLLDNIEKQRKVLSGGRDYDFSIDCLLQDQDFLYTMTRDTFEQVSRPLFEQLAEFLANFRQQLTDRGLSPQRIELLGGGSRIPLFIAKAAQVFGIEPSRTLNSSQAVARGAALWAAMQSGLFRVRNYLALEASPCGLVCGWNCPEEAIQDEGSQTNILAPGESVLTDKTVELTLHNSQSQLQFSLWQSELYPGLNPAVASFRLQLPPAQLTQRKLALTVTFDCNGLLKAVAAKELGQEERSLQIKEFALSSPLTEEQVKALTVAQKEALARDQRVLQRYEQRNHFESQIYALKNRVQAIEKEFLGEQSLQEVVALLQTLQDDIEQIQDYAHEIKRADTAVASAERKAKNLLHKHEETNAALSKLENYIASFKGKQGPQQPLEQATDWVRNCRLQLANCPRFQQPPLSPQKILQAAAELKEKVQEWRAEEGRKEQARMRQCQTGYKQVPYFGSSSFRPFGGSESSFGRLGSRGRCPSSSYFPYGSFF